MRATSDPKGASPVRATSGPKGARSVQATSGAKRGWEGRRQASRRGGRKRNGRITLCPYNHSVVWNNQVGDALSGANCGFSTLNPYGGWGSVFCRDGAKGAVPTNNAPCTHVGSLGIPNPHFKRKAKRMAFGYNGSHLKMAVSGSSFR